jgi:DNA-binding Lrp family transcriptional regulator
MPVMRRHSVLSEQELAILASLGTVGVTSIAALADAANLKAHTARYGLQNLLDRHLLSPFCSIDPATLGFSAYITYFSLTPTSLTKVDEGVREMVAHQNVSWVGEMTGTYQYGCTVYARDATHAMLLIEQITSRMGIPWQKKSLTQRTGVIFWPLKFFSTDLNSTSAIEYPNRPLHQEIDQLDHQLLRIKGRNPTMPNNEIARLVGSAASTVTYRVEQLVAKGVILGSWYIPNWNSLGLSHSEISVVTKAVSPSLIHELIAFGRRARNCQFVVTGLGGWDLQFNVLSSHPTELQAFTGALWANYGDNIDSLTVNGYTRLLKYSTYPFVELGGESIQPTARPAKTK